VEDIKPFLFSEPSYREIRSREISRLPQRPSERVLLSVMVGCQCGNVWRAQRGKGLEAVVGGHIITCPACRVSKMVSGREITQ
jgi:hypothetical protein